MPLKIIYERNQFNIMQRLTVGRNPASDLVLNDGMVSGNHGIFNAGCFTDLGSTNGSLLNGKPCKPRFKNKLKSGDKIMLGEAKLMVQEGEAVQSGAQEQNMMMSKRFGANCFSQESEEEAKMSVRELMDQEFDKIIGHGSIKEQMEQFHKKVQLDEIRTKNGRSVDTKKLFHMIFQGPPGTGKTTMANLVAKVMLKMKLVKTDKVVFVNNALELLAGYSGQTAPKVDAKVEEARGGVLFIDEAYSIVKSKDGNQKDSFGKEAIECIMKHLDPPSCVFIFAGYEKEMTSFLDVNPGLSRRIPYRYVFKPYEVDELKRIFVAMSDGKGEKVAADVIAEVPGMLEALDDGILLSQNAGFISNWLSFAQIERDDRVDIDEAMANPTLAMTLELIDLRKGMDKIEKSL